MQTPSPKTHLMFSSCRNASSHRTNNDRCCVELLMSVSAERLLVGFHDADALQSACRSFAEDKRIIATSYSAIASNRGDMISREVICASTAVRSLHSPQVTTCGPASIAHRQSNSSERGGVSPP